MIHATIPNGYVVIARKIRRSSLWLSLKATHRLVMLELLLQAQFQDGNVVRNGEIIDLKRGQIATSYQMLIDEIGDRDVTVKVVRNAIEKLVKHGFLVKDEAKARAKQGLLLTIVKYDFYQDTENYKGKAKDKEEGITGAKEGQSEGKARAISNKDKNLNNVKNEKDISAEIKNFRERYSSELLILIDQYFEFIAGMRKGKKIGPGIFLKVYRQFARYSPIRIEYAIRTHMSNDQNSKAEEAYTFGIMRNSTDEESKTKIEVLNNKGTGTKGMSIREMGEELKRQKEAGQR